MAREEATCWRCGAQWTSEERPRTTLVVERLHELAPVIAGDAPTHAAGAPQPRIAVADNARATAEASLETDRWINEGGSFNREPAAGVDAATLDRPGGPARLRALHR